MKALRTIGIGCMVVLSTSALAGASTPAVPEGFGHAVREESGTIPTIPALDIATPGDLLTALFTGADYLQTMQADVTDDNAGNGVNGVDESPDDPDDGGWD